MSPMKDVIVGQFNDGYLPIMDGVTLTVRNYAYWLNRILGPTYVVTPWFPGHKDAEPFPVIRYFSVPTIVRPPYRIGIPDFDAKLQDILRKRRFSLVHAHSPFGAGRAALKVAREKRIPIVATFHSKFREDLMRAFPVKAIVNEQVDRIVDFFHSVDEVWVPQESVALTLREYGYRGPYQVVENGIDLQPPVSVDEPAAAGARHLGLDGETPMGLFVGQHILEKNLEFLVRSLPAVIAAVPGFRMVFVGQGYAKEQLKELVAKLGIASSVIFHPVIHDRELLKSIYARADIFLFPSKYDNAPLVVREAAAYRAPSVMLAGSTAAEVIRDRENGFLSPDDVEAYAATVIGALRDRPLLERVGLGASATLCRSWRDVAGEVRDRYLGILSRWA